MSSETKRDVGSERAGETKSERASRLVRGIESHRLWDGLYKLALYASIVIAFLVGVFPIYWMAQTAFTTPQAILEGVTAFPTLETFTFGNFTTLVDGEVTLFMLNTVIVAVGTMLLVNVISLIAGYGLARFEFPQKTNFARFLLFGYMFSPIMLGLPLFLIWKNLGLLNTRIGLILALTAITLPFSVWLTWKYMQTIPRSMEESAWIVGASRLQAFRDVVLPQTPPVLIATSLVAFMIAWTDFTFAQLLVPKEEVTTFGPGLLQLITSSYEVSWGELMAASLLMTIPPFLFAYFLQGYLLKGFELRTN